MVSISAKRKDMIVGLCECIADRSFSESDVLAFLILVRDYTNPGSFLREFGSSIAHAVRDRGKLFDAVSALVEFDQNGTPAMGNSKPIGSVGIETSNLAIELREVFKMHCDRELCDTAIEEFQLALITLLHSTPVVTAEGRVIGYARACITESRIYLLISTDVISSRLLCLMYVPNREYYLLNAGDYELIDVTKSIKAKRIEENFIIVSEPKII